MRIYSEKCRKKEEKHGNCGVAEICGNAGDCGESDHAEIHKRNVGKLKCRRRRNKKISQKR